MVCVTGVDVDQRQARVVDGPRGHTQGHPRRQGTTHRHMSYVWIYT